jgi:hypothetical protein
MLWVGTHDPVSNGDDCRGAKQQWTKTFQRLVKNVESRFVEETTSYTESREGSLMPSRKNSLANNIEQFCDLKTFMHCVVCVVRRLLLEVIVSDLS